MNLVGEQLVTASNAFAVADAAEAQAEAALSDGSSRWESYVVPRSSVIIERRGITGAFASSNILVTRGSHVVHANADEVFRTLISPAGYTIIDPSSDVEEFSKYLERFEGWR